MKTSEYTKFVVITFGLLALFLLFAFLLKSAVEVLLLIFAGILFAIFIRGLSRFVTKFMHLPEKLGIATTLFLLFLSFTVFLILLAPQLAEQGQKLAEEIPEALDNLRKKMGSMDWLEDLIRAGEGSNPLSAAGKMTGKALGIFATTFGLVSSLFVIPFVGLYLSFTPGYYIDGLLRLVPGDGRPRARQIIQALDHTLSFWLIGRFVGMLVVSIATFIGLFFLNVPLSLSLAVFAGVLTFIPNIGPIISAVPAILLGYTQSPATALYVVLLYLFIQIVESYIITPLIQQRVVALPPVLTLSSQIVLGSVLGFLGLLLATPLTAAALVLVKMLYVEDVLGEQANVDGVEE